MAALAGMNRAMPPELVKGEMEWMLALSGVVDVFDAALLHAPAWRLCGLDGPMGLDAG